MYTIILEISCIASACLYQLYTRMAFRRLQRNLFKNEKNLNSIQSLQLPSSGYNIVIIQPAGNNPFQYRFSTGAAFQMLFISILGKSIALLLPSNDPNYTVRLLLCKIFVMVPLEFFIVEAYRFIKNEFKNAKIEQAECKRIENNAFESFCNDQYSVYLHTMYSPNNTLCLTIIRANVSRRMYLSVMVDVHVSNRIYIDTSMNTYRLGSFIHQMYNLTGDPLSDAAITEGLLIIRKVASLYSNDGFAHLLMHVAGELLAKRHEVKTRETRRIRIQRDAQCKIRSAWTRAITDPTHPACKRRLERELTEMNVDLQSAKLTDGGRRMSPHNNKSTQGMLLLLMQNR